MAFIISCITASLHIKKYPSKLEGYFLWSNMAYFVNCPAIQLSSKTHRKEARIMTIDSSMYVHPLDNAALKALKAIPGFTPLLKAFMRIWSEQLFLVENMASNIRLGEKQLPKYYNMLPPICEKLGIDVPDLYLKLDVYPNAYTAGDTKPFIVMTSGLLESVPDELIPTVLAHECGHIACHHVLYSTMGQMILNGAISKLELGNLISIPLQLAFFHWMRCSELSADRAASIANGSANNTIEMCARFAGFDRDIHGELNLEAFMEQAEDYMAMTKESKWSKALEFMMYSQIDHPLNAVRAYEANKWQQSPEFAQILSCLQQNENAEKTTGTKSGASAKVSMQRGAEEFRGDNVNCVRMELQFMGFTNFKMNRIVGKFSRHQDNDVVEVTVNGAYFQQGDWFPSDAQIEITYYDSIDS